MSEESTKYIKLIPLDGYKQKPTVQTTSSIKLIPLATEQQAPKKYHKESINHPKNIAKKEAKEKLAKEDYDKLIQPSKKVHDYIKTDTNLDQFVQTVERKKNSKKLDKKVYLPKKLSKQAKKLVRAIISNGK